MRIDLPADVEVIRLKKIIEVLKDQVESGMNSRGGDYDVFRSTIVLEKTVMERTAQLKEAMNSIAKANKEIIIAKNAAEIAEMQIRAVINNISEAFAFYDHDDRLRLYNKKFVSLYSNNLQAAPNGLTYEQILRSAAASGKIAGASEQWLLDRVKAHKQGKSGREFQTGDGRWIKISERLFENVGVIALYEDVTDIKRREAALRESDQAEHALLMQVTMESLSQGVSVLDRERCLTAWNGRLAQLLRLPANSLSVGLPYLDLLGRMGVQASASVLEDARSFECHLPWGCVLEIQHSPMPNGGIVATWSDITERKAGEQRMRHMATHDILTGLANRALLNERLQWQVEQIAVTGQTGALLLLDLNNFKSINDTLGHTVGDEVLRGVARRLAPHMRSTDLFARLGGDEFAIIRTPVDGREDLQAFVQALQDQLAQPFHVSDMTIHTSASIGITTFPGDSEHPQTLLSNADIAMYRAKALRESGCMFFSPELHQKIRERKQLEEDMRLGLERNEFFLLYQPKVRSENGSICGFEALIRWNHPKRGLVSPVEFIPIAEQCGLIVPLGEWALLTACRQMKAWHDLGLVEKMKMAVNVSPIQFQRGNPLAVISSVLDMTGLLGHYLEIEITEGALIDDFAATRAVLSSINELGVSVSVDDFGTGYSSLGYLDGLPVDKLKIDKMFIQNLTLEDQGEDARGAIVRAIISLAHTLRMTVVAEGVEDFKQLLFLKGERCEEIQGYLFSKPVTPEACEELLQAPGVIRIHAPEVDDWHI